MRIPWRARSLNLNLKEINLTYSFEGLLLKLKLQQFGRLTHWERLGTLGKTEGERRRAASEDKMVIKYNWLGGHESE